MTLPALRMIWGKVGGIAQEVGEGARGHIDDAREVGEAADVEDTPANPQEEVASWFVPSLRAMRLPSAAEGAGRWQSYLFADFANMPSTSMEICY
jgi:hypothetical protein